MSLTGYVTITAGEALSVGRVVKSDGTYADADTDVPFAVTKQACTASGDLVDGAYAADSELLEYTSTAPAIGDILQVTTDGKVVVDATPEAGSWTVGRCVQAGSGGYCRASIKFDKIGATP